MKICTKCNELKSLIEYTTNKRTKSGKCAHCKKCAHKLYGRKPTGWAKGRPRKGEIRPATDGGLWQAKYKEDHSEYVLLYQREYQRIWRENNRARHNEISRNALQRKKLWGDAQVLLTKKGNIKIVVKSQTQQNYQVQSDE